MFRVPQLVMKAAAVRHLWLPSLLLLSLLVVGRCVAAVEWTTHPVAGSVSSNTSISSASVRVDAAAPTPPADAANASAVKLRRGKRYLDFTRGTRVSWRTGVKNNLLRVNTLWAYAFGFRFNYPFADRADRRRPFFRRDVLHMLEESLSVHGFDGRACVLKSYCSSILDADSQLGGGVLFKLLKLLFSLDSRERRHLPHLRAENCEQLLHTHCPLSFNSISPFTDDA